MPKKKEQKIPYQEYQAIKQKEARRFFRISLYPWPVLTAMLVPLAIFLLMLTYYFLIIRKLPD